MMEMLGDEEWVRLKAALDVARSGTGRPLVDERRVVEGIVCRQRNGAKWRALPPEFGPWWKAAQLRIRWSRAGVWTRAFEWLRDAGLPDLGWVFLDGTSVRAHLDGPPAQKGGREPGARAFARRLRLPEALGAADASGRAVLFMLVPDQASEVRVAPAMLEDLCRRGTVGRVVCDRGTSAKAWREAIHRAGAEPCVPGQRTHPRAPPHDRAAYRRRHRIENLWARPKEWRALATRYDKTAQSFPGGLHLAASLDWLSIGP